ncbi:aminotransferase-like domain-containing protein [Agarivorans sp. MS3-6]|uniref:aminotransferase-like domain-containing protein n=1 Tax=Agarivorans sp. TSD2052 TaxID=2937286 RepID=UPI00200C748C|nr:PLP-dependent aminotransferase family protein [Agarivorans sp. TSD2052]UPW19665.1 PLP-dependent aminotransferase family protein [Agarivorans sp. TSD2052]
MTLYEQFAEELKEQINQAYYPIGQKLPSIREMSKTRGLSISTVQESYRLLEDAGLVRSKHKSGYYVKQPANAALLPEISQPEQRPVPIDNWQAVLALTMTESSNGFLALGRGSPDTSFSSLKPLQRLMADSIKHQAKQIFSCSKGNGLFKLRVQIARLMQNSGCHIHPDNLQITAGCQEALSLCLKALTQPGDIVAIDSPSFYGSMQAIRSNQLKVLEIPTHPETGISLPALELALEQWPIKVLQLIPSSNNPLGYEMPEKNKHKLLALAEKHNFAIIEDDILGDTIYRTPRPRSLKSYDSNERVLFCSSFSKTIAPGLRVGWVAAGRYSEMLTHLKFISSLGSNSLPLLAVADFIEQGYYEKHLRLSKQQYQASRDVMLHWVQRYFPQGTKMSFPQGGFFLWVELPDRIDCLQLNENLKPFKIGIAAGSLFSASGKYQHCLRLSYANKPNDKIEQAVKTIGEQAKLLLNTPQ